MAKQEKARYWLAVAYPENMQPDWQDTIGDVIGLPLAYCIHDKDHLAQYQAKRQSDQERQRKTHIHLIMAFPNTTTYNTALTLVNKLSLDGKQCCNKVESSNSIRNSYEYLIHNTETCKKQKKYLYDASERITVNNFDIGAYEQISIQDKHNMAKEICNEIIRNQIMNFADLFMFVESNYDSEYMEILMTNHGLFERLTKGNYQKASDEYKKVMSHRNSR
jgi:hypothetical protein